MKTSAILTKRESEIAELLAWGASKKDIANRLFVSERTVENHTRNIYDKIGCQKINELSAWWFCTKFNISFSLSPLARIIKKQTIKPFATMIKKILKEISGGQDLTPRQRAIFMWWSLSLTFAVICAESIVACGIFVASFALASKYMDELPTPKDDSPEL